MESLNPNEPLTKLSPFLVEKAIQGRFGSVKKVTKMKSGALLIEAARPTQAKMILDTTMLINTEVKATAHRSLNTSKGVIRGLRPGPILNDRILRSLKNWQLRE